MTMSNRADERTAMPTIAGILNVAVGGICLLGVLGLLIAAIVVAPFNTVSDLPFAVSALLLIIAAPLAVLGSVSLVGGIFSLQRRLWGWALAGSITTLFLTQVFGVISIVLTALSRKEFAQ
jgi:hypothetical protein